jgi:hypothetical protein
LNGFEKAVAKDEGGVKKGPVGNRIGAKYVVSQKTKRLKSPPESKKI